jgi:hypothetical protein
MGAAVAGTLAKLLVNRPRPGKDVRAVRGPDATGAGPVESLNDSAGTPASAATLERAWQPPPS